MPGVTRDKTNYQQGFSDELFGRGLSQQMCVHKCFLAVTLREGRDMCSRAISSHEGAHNLTLRQAQPAQRMAAALSIAARMVLWVVLASWQRESIGGADMHTGCRHSTERTQRSRKWSGPRGDAALLGGTASSEPPSRGLSARRR